jgi:zinc/manganese transport system permease protein
LGGAALFALTRRSRRIVSQEAIVGLVYAVATASMVLLLSRAAHGAERIQDLLVGSLLLSGWSDVIRLCVAYVPIAVMHIVLARRFVQMSWHPDEAEGAPSRVALWDFVFYASFGIVITLSVQIAGVLLVFSFLIAPALITQMFTSHRMVRWLAGWGLAAVASLLGLWWSWSWDLPTGAAVVAAFGLLLVLAVLLRMAAVGSAAQS